MLATDITPDGIAVLRLDNEQRRNALSTAMRDSSRRYHLAVWGFTKPMIAAVNGAAMGGGFDLCLLCDGRTLCRDCSQIATSEGIAIWPQSRGGALTTPLRMAPTVY